MTVDEWIDGKMDQWIAVKIHLSKHSKDLGSWSNWYQ